MDLSVGSVEHAEMVPRYDAAALHRMGQAANASRRHFNLFRLLCLWLGRPVLARRHSPGLLPAHAVLCE